MGEKTPAQLSAISTPVQDADLLVAYRGAGPMTKVAASDLKTYINTGAGAGDLLAANNLSDVASIITARTNLGLGSAALLASSAILAVANNLSDLASASTARTNLGLGSAALKATGTSGDAVPLLNGNNTFSGTAAFSSTLAVTGAATFDGAVTLGNAAGDAITVTGTATFGQVAAFSAGATTTTITASGTATFNGDTVIGNAAGDALTVAGSAVTWSGNPTHSGNHTFSGNLTVNGNTTIGNASGDTLTVAPNAITWSGNPTHSGNHTFSGNVVVSGAATFNGTVALGNASGDTITATGNADFQNNVTLGSSSADTITVNGTVSGLTGLPTAIVRATISAGPTITQTGFNATLGSGGGTGDYTVTFGTPMASAAYAILLSGQRTAAGGDVAICSYHSVTDSGFGIRVENNGGSGLAATGISAVVFGPGGLT